MAHIKHGYFLTPGPAYYLKDEMEVGPFEVVEVDEEIAARCREALRTKVIDGSLNACWQDPATEAWYAQPIE